MTYNPVKFCLKFYDKSKFPSKIILNKDILFQKINLNKINQVPEFARGYEKEYRFIRGINKESIYLVNKLDKINKSYIRDDYYEDLDNNTNMLNNLSKNDNFYKEFFESKTFNRFENLIKIFLRGQKIGKLKYINNLVFPKVFLDNIRYINNFFCFYKLSYVESYYSGFKEIYDLFKKFFNQLVYEDMKDIENDIEETFYFDYYYCEYKYFFYSLCLVFKTDAWECYKSI